jgi:hypothetical protein
MLTTLTRPQGISDQAEICCLFPGAAHWRGCAQSARRKMVHDDVDHSAAHQQKGASSNLGSARAVQRHSLRQLEWMESRAMPGPIFEVPRRRLHPQEFLQSPVPCRLWASTRSLPGESRGGFRHTRLEPELTAGRSDGPLSFEPRILRPPPLPPASVAAPSADLQGPQRLGGPGPASSLQSRLAASWNGSVWSRCSSCCRPGAMA